MGGAGDLQTFHTIEIAVNYLSSLYDNPFHLTIRERSHQHHFIKFYMLHLWIEIHKKSYCHDDVTTAHKALLNGAFQAVLEQNMTELSCTSNKSVILLPYNS